MKPLDFARRLAASDRPADVILGVAIVARGLTDDDPATFRQGWPITPDVIRRAANFIGVSVLDDVAVAEVIATMPTVSDAMLNKGAVR